MTELTENEKILDNKIKELKREFEEQCNGNIPYDMPTLNDVRISNSNLYKLCKKLPKGGDLHLHDFQLLSSNDLIELFSKRQDVIICIKKGETFGYMKYLPKGKEIPNGYMLFRQAMEDGVFTKDEFLDFFTLKNEKKYKNKWDKFEELFKVVGGLATDSELYKEMFKLGFTRYCENNIFLIEPHFLMFADIDTMRPLVKRVRQAYYEVKKIYPKLVVRLIGGGLKCKPIFDSEDARKRLHTTIKLKEEIKDEFDPNNIQEFIIGFDLLNEEDKSFPLSDYQKMLKEEKKENIQYFLHAGESLKTENNNILTAYDIGVKRIGHGFNLYRFPKLMDEIINKDIALEVCPISNRILGYVDDLRLHPAVKYLKKGIPIVICSDDAEFQELTPLVDDYFAAIICWNLNLSQIKMLVKNSILYSGLSSEETQKIMDDWKESWNIFVKKEKE